jgi:hypothetical integral membrane protein (TIGR02206 family)
VDGLFAPDHLLALLVIAAVGAVLVVAARRAPGRWVRVAALLLAVTLVGAEVGWWLFLATTGSSEYQLASALPLQLCDMAIFIGALALVLRTQILIEVTYFWGLAGTLQALLTPDLPQGFPSFPYFQYYVAHGGIVIAALLLVVGMRCRPRRDAIWRVMAITFAYVAFVGAVDAFSGLNYMYLRAKPPTASLFDLMGPWPWYLVVATGVGVVLFLILDAPFRLSRRTPLESGALP